MGPFTPPNETNPHPKFDSFNIDYLNNKSSNITFPLGHVKDPDSFRIILEDQFFYIRTIHPDNSSNSSLPQQSVYFIDQDITPKLALASNLTAEQVDSWRNTVFPPGEKGRFYLYIV
jgi:hypothetical protein